MQKCNTLHSTTLKDYVSLFTRQSYVESVTKNNNNKKTLNKKNKLGGF